MLNKKLQRLIEELQEEQSEIFTEEELQILFEELELDTDKYAFGYLAEELGFDLVNEEALFEISDELKQKTANKARKLARDKSGPFGSGPHWSKVEKFRRQADRLEANKTDGVLSKVPKKEKADRKAAHTAESSHWKSEYRNYHHLKKNKNPKKTRYVRNKRVK